MTIISDEPIKLEQCSLSWIFQDRLWWVVVSLCITVGITPSLWCWTFQGLSWWEGPTWYCWACGTSWKTRSSGASWTCWRERSFCECVVGFVFSGDCSPLTHLSLSLLSPPFCLQGWERPDWPSWTWWTAGSRGSAWPSWTTRSTRGGWR